MTRERQEPRIQFAPPGTLAGKLQRGLGTGFLEALKTPREDLHPLLIECIQTDPALDIHLDDRDFYYGELALRTELNVEPLVEFVHSAGRDEAEDGALLTLDVFAHLAKRGDEKAEAWLRDYVQWGSDWCHILQSLDHRATTSAWTGLAETIARRAVADPECLPLWGEPFESWARSVPAVAAITHLTPPGVYRRRLAAAARRLHRQSTASLLIPPAGPTTPQIRELATRTSEEDLAAIEDATSNPVPMTRAIALGAQFERGDFRHFDQLLQMATVEQRPPAASGIAWHAALKAPADKLLPLARKWRSSRVWRRRLFASQVFELHATNADLPWVESSIKRASASDPDERFILTNLSEIVAARFSGREFPALRRKFDAFTYSYGRQYIAEALAATDSTFASTRAFCSLWDCQRDVRVIAAEHVSLEVPGAAERLREMADDSLEDERLKGVVGRRLAVREP